MAARQLRLEKGKLIEKGREVAVVGAEFHGAEGLYMFKFAPYVLKSLWRHRSRTMLTVSGSAVALFVFCFVGAVQQGLARLTEDQQAQRTLIVFQENRFCPASSKLPEDYARTVAKMPGVKDVVPIKVFTNNCRASLDVVVFNGMPPEKLRTARELDAALGRLGRVRQPHRRGRCRSSGRAAPRRLKAGQKFTIGEVTVSIVGVFRSTVAAEDNYIYTHLDFLQRARGKNSVGTVTQLKCIWRTGPIPIAWRPRSTPSSRAARWPPRRGPKASFSATRSPTWRN